MSIYLKLLAVQKAVDTIPKRGYNDYHKYHYATEADILGVKNIMNQQGVVVLSNMIHQETGFKPDGKSGWAKVTLSFRLVDAETGECVETQFTGYAEDKADKAIYKATTGANKYFYLKYFGVATGDDPEQEHQAPEQKNTAPAQNVGQKLEAQKPSQESAVKKEAPRPNDSEGSVAKFVQGRV